MSTKSVLSVSPTSINDFANAGSPIITVVELARQLGLDGQADIRLSDAAHAASAMVENYCHTKFRRRRYIETWHDRPCDVISPYDIRLKRAPAWTIDSVTDADSATVAAADYALINPEISVMRFYETAPFSLVSDRWTLAIEYVAGYDTIPDDLKRATLEVAQRIYRSSGSTEGMVQSESLGDWSATYSQAFISGPTRGILDDYRVLSLW